MVHEQTGRSRKFASDVSIRALHTESLRLHKAFSYISQRDHQRHWLNRRWFESKREIKRLGVIRDCMDNDAADADRIGGMHHARCGVPNHRPAETLALIRAIDSKPGEYNNG